MASCQSGKGCVRVCHVKLSRVRFKSAVAVSQGASKSVLEACEGWDIEASAEGVRATRSNEGIWVPNTEVQCGNFEPQPVAFIPDPRKANK